MDVQQQQAMQGRLDAALQQVAEMQDRLARGEQQANVRLEEEKERSNRTDAHLEGMARSFIDALNLSKGEDKPRKPKADPKPIFKKEVGEDYLIFQGHFDVWAELQELTDDYKKKSLFTAFQGNAGRVARIFGPDSESWALPYAEYEARVRSVFASKAQSEAAKSMFEVRVQTKAESCQEYAAEKMALFLIAYPASADQTLLVREYIRGLHSPEIKKVVVRQAGSGFQQVVDMANNEEAAIIYLSNLNKYQTSFAATGNPATTFKQEAMDLSDMSLAAMGRGGRDQFGRFIRRGRGNGAPATGPGGRDWPRDGCWRCGDPSHLRRECPKPRDGGEGDGRGGARGGGRGGGRGGPPRGGGRGAGGGRGGSWGNPANPRWRHFAAMFNDLVNYPDDHDYYYDAETEPRKAVTGPEIAGAVQKADF
jgi:hypothetical protein